MSEGSASRSGAEAMKAFDKAASCAAPPMGVADDDALSNRESSTGTRERDMPDVRRGGGGWFLLLTRSILARVDDKAQLLQCLGMRFQHSMPDSLAWKASRSQL